ncbi:MAG: glycoside hydrolase family 127 protein, partial [Candidatus Hydrogenedentes bacterium]|nr:glycoside hydrolase family 127 protein [Candidatus Hydrogenedentota bacterium]
FPLGLRLRAGEFDPGIALPDGADVRVVQQGAVLDQEIVRWSPDLAELNVRVPHISAGTPGQYVDLYYGNPKAPAAPQADLWSAPYDMVLHLEGTLDNAASDKIVEAVHATVDEAGLVLSNPESYLSYTPTVSDNLTVTVRFRIEGGQPTVQTLASGVGSDGKDWFNFALKIPSIVHTNSASQGRLVPELNPEGVSLNEWHSASVAYDSAAGTRTICIDGKILAKDHYLPGPMHLDSIRIGRGVLHFDPWQVVGRMDEVRVATVARSDAWLRAETAGLADDNVFVAVGPIETQNGPAPAPGKFALLAPSDGLDVRKREGILLEWRPAAGAETYSVNIANAATGEALNTYDAGNATRYLLASDGLEGHTVTWTVTAHSANGESQAREARQLTFYDWKEAAMAEPPDMNVAPALQFARDAEYDLDGYLRGRIDRVIDQYLTMLPVTSPAVLQVLRDRDKRPVRDPLVPWAGEFAGKYLTCAQLTWRLTQDAELKTVIDQFVRDLIACQGQDGYLGPFPEADRLVGGNWDVWGHYHCMLGLLFYYEDTGYTPALDACQHAADLLFETFGPGGPTLTNDGAGGQMNMAICHGL